MKRLTSILLAVIMVIAAPAFLTSCQEDAPEINYTINVSVINDFTSVVEAINNGSIKNEEAINRLKEAIDKMNTDQQTKLNAIIEVIKSMNTTLETKLAAIEAAIRAQTLDMNTKLDLLITAINELPDYTSQLEAIKTVIANLPDYGDKLEAIKTAIGALPNYNDKFDAVVTALNLMKAQIEALGTGQTAIATQIGNVITAINNLITAVNNGNADAATALAEIIQKLAELKAAIAGGSSGGGTTPEAEYVDLGLPSGIKWATKKLGAPWRMPTEEDFGELKLHCTWTWTTQDGKSGYEVKGTNGNAIFLPAAGWHDDSDFKYTGKTGYY